MMAQAGRSCGIMWSMLPRWVRWGEYWEAGWFAGNWRRCLPIDTKLLDRSSNLVLAKLPHSKNRQMNLEHLPEWLSQIHVASTLYMVGLIWFVQVVHYPLFALAKGDEFENYIRTNMRLTSWVVILPMVAEGEVPLPYSGLDQREFRRNS